MSSRCLHTPVVFARLLYATTKRRSNGSTSNPALANIVVEIAGLHGKQYHEMHSRFYQNVIFKAKHELLFMKVDEY